ASSAIHHQRGIQAVGWLKRLLDGQRDGFEKGMSNNSYDGFRVVEQNQDGVIVPAARRPEYLPLCFIEPFEGNATFLGLDAYSHPVGHEERIKACDSDSPVATGRIQLARVTENQSDVAVFLPVYRTNQPHETLQERRQNLRGYVTARIRVGDL